MKQYSVTDLAKEIGVSKATISRKLRALGVSPVETRGKKKLYDKKVLKQLLSEKTVKSKTKTPTTIELLQEQNEILKNQVELLKKQLETKDQLLKKQLETKDQQISTLTQLASQAQALNLADKPLIESKQVKKVHWWEKFLLFLEKISTIKIERR